MADVRALLRGERTSRRVAHPYAAYTESGKLICKPCNTQIKTESLWATHLKSREHGVRLEVLREVSVASSNKKRKLDEEEDDGRKRAKGLEDSVDVLPPLAEESPDLDSREGTTEQQSLLGETSGVTADRVAILAPHGPASVPDEEDEEWLAFQREINADAFGPASTQSINAAATISAAPMTAEEIAAQAREEQSTQRGRKDAEIEAEKEDAARALEEEFEEMEGLEDRVRRLREKREALRTKRRSGSSDEVIAAAVPAEVGATVSGLVIAEAGSKKDNEESDNGDGGDDGDDDSDDDSDDFDDWTFGTE